MAQLQVVNVQDVVMDKLYSRYHNPYPSLLERLEAIQSHSMESRKEKAD